MRRWPRAIPAGRVNEPPRDKVDKRDRVRTYAFSTHHLGRCRKREQDEGVIVEVERFIDRLVVKVETPGETSVAQQRRPSQEIKSQRNRLLGARYVVSRRFGEHIGLARRDAQAPKRGRALQRGGIEVFVEGAALPIDSVFKPERPRLVRQPA